ncbi:MAG: TRAP transporter small permease [Alphaproteobacteria bacterium]|nr:TRAP transporter small permease [Alphaproteobacteria bacterium]
MSTGNPLGQAARKATSIVKYAAIGANAIGTLTVLVLVVVMNIDVVARGVFHAPFLGVVEIVIFSMILIVFLQLPDVVRVNRLTRSDGFLGLITDLRPRFANVLSRCIDLLACVVMATIAYATFPEFTEAFESCHYFVPPEFGPAKTGDFWEDFWQATARCHYFGTLGVFTVPWWPAKFAITASTAVCAVLFLLKVLIGSEPVEGPSMAEHPSDTDPTADGDKSP